MSLANSLLVALIVMSIVFGVLALLSIMLKIQTSVISYLNKNKKGHVDTDAIIHTVDKTSEIEKVEISTGELQLIDVDERTAAMIMALTSDELQIPLNELQFKSIKVLD